MVKIHSTGRDFNQVRPPTPLRQHSPCVNHFPPDKIDLRTNETHGREYGTESPEPVEHRTYRDPWAHLRPPERRLIQESPREVPCFQCVHRMMRGGFDRLCRDHLGTILLRGPHLKAADLVFP